MDDDVVMLEYDYCDESFLGVPKKEEDATNCCPVCRLDDLHN